jgi:putative nucleotidyltransferase with HDIG domain
MNNIPDEATCRSLMDRYSMLPNIVEHSYRVCQVATFLGRALSRRENGLDSALIVASSLLHDITKTRSLKTREKHAGTGGDLLEELGYPRVAEVVRRHVQLPEGDEILSLGEAHIINYADKRVRHETVVSLGERFVDLMDRYGKTSEVRMRLERMRETAFEIEKSIFRRVDVTPDDLRAFNRLSPFDLDTLPTELGGRC